MNTKTVLTTTFQALVCTFVFAQSPNFSTSSKLIENSHTANGLSNVGSKSNDIEKLFFGDFNAKVEFLCEPSFYGASGLRIYRDSADHSYLLETKRITNWEEVNELINEKYPPAPAKIETTTLEQWEQRRRENIEQQAKIDAERLSSYQIKRTIVPIGDTLTSRLYATLVEAIGKMENKKSPASSDGIIKIVKDGTSATFRCVVDNQLWTLRCHMPDGDFERLSDIFMQIIADVEADSFDQAKYLELLDN